MKGVCNRGMVLLKFWPNTSNMLSDSNLTGLFKTSRSSGKYLPFFSKTTKKNYISVEALL